MGQMQGFNLQNPGMLQRGTFGPSPHDVAMMKQEEVRRAVPGLANMTHIKNQEIINRLEQMTPEMVEAMRSINNDSVYEGVSDSFATNRLKILLQRRREDDVYAFI